MGKERREVVGAEGGRGFEETEFDCESVFGIQSEFVSNDGSGAEGWGWASMLWTGVELKVVSVGEAMDWRKTFGSFQMRIEQSEEEVRRWVLEYKGMMAVIGASWALG